MNGIVEWLSFLRNVGGVSILSTMSGALLRILRFLVTMWFVVSLVFFSHISPQLRRFSPPSVSASTPWFGISCMSFLLLIVNFLSTPAMVIISRVSRLIEDLQTVVRIFDIMCVQLSQEEYFFHLHCTHSPYWVDWQYSQHLL